MLPNWMTGALLPPTIMIFNQERPQNGQKPMQNAEDDYRVRAKLLQEMNKAAREYNQAEARGRLAALKRYVIALNRLTDVFLEDLTGNELASGQPSPIPITVQPQSAGLVSTRDAREQRRKPSSVYAGLRKPAIHRAVHSPRMRPAE